MIADLDDARIPKHVAKLKIPVVGIGGIDAASPLKLTVSTVGTNNEGIAVMAADYLMRLGLENFGYCGVPGKTVDP